LTPPSETISKRQVDVLLTLLKALP